MPQSDQAPSASHPIGTDWESVASTLAAGRETDFSFDDPLNEAEAALHLGVVSPLGRVGILHVAGDDAEGFLHGQLTNAVEGMTPGASVLAAYCSPKGRALALLRVVRVDDGYLLLLDAGVLGAVHKRLQMFVLRSKVTITDCTGELAALGLSGPGGGMLLAEAVGSPPRAVGEVTAAGDLRAVRLLGEERFLVTGPAPQIGPLWSLLTRGLQPVGSEAWRLTEIRAGMPEVVPQTTEHFVPLMLNLEPLGGISYRKGCYPGQEVVARMHSRGRLNRRLYRVSVETGVPPLAGTPVRTAEGREAGEVVLTARTGQDRCEALAVLRIEEAGRHDLLVDGSAVGVLDLPYSVE